MYAARDEIILVMNLLAGGDLDLGGLSRQQQSKSCRAPQENLTCIKSHGAPSSIYARSLPTVVAVEPHQKGRSLAKR